MDSRLHTAVRYGDEESVLSALNAGLDPNQLGLLKWNPIHEAAHNGEREILKLLLRYKGDVDLQDNLHGNTALHYAAKEDNSACVTVLLKSGARTDIRNRDGLTCIDVATSFCKDIIQDFGDVDLQDNLHGNTALHYAAKEDNSACVTVLLKSGARTDIRNRDGLTCIDVATSFCKDIIQDYASPQQGDLRLSGPPPGQGAGSGARTRDRRVPADFRADSQATVLPMPPMHK
ncbi:ankyrin repeat [Plakobranchus ocellatus]|uniref:Ankyrin repeat n=1 Tax=Plakobranchus ocellatus TaxID=259542 RepID=A0AAV4CW11_9GAST|nr:ankyrin repeat [Plakobranchus ocellatus]